MGSDKQTQRQKKTTTFRIEPSELLKCQEFKNTVVMHRRGNRNEKDLFWAHLPSLLHQSRQ